MGESLKWKSVICHWFFIGVFFFFFSNSILVSRQINHLTFWLIK